MKKNFLLSILVFLLAGLGCTSKKNREMAQSHRNSQEVKSGDDNGLTPFEVKNGIGPITEKITLDTFDKNLAEKGKKIFEQKCSACHKIGERYVGPDLQHVLNRRTPAYVMNMMMNPAEMIQRHPTARGLLTKYLTPMANQDVSREEARAIVEYFRLVNTSPESK